MPSLCMRGGIRRLGEDNNGGNGPMGERVPMWHVDFHM